VITIDVNGVSQHIDIEPDTPLLWVLRDAIGLTGNKIRLWYRAAGGRLHGAYQRRRDGGPVRLPIVLSMAQKWSPIARGLPRTTAIAGTRRAAGSKKAFHSCRLLPVRARSLAWLHLLNLPLPSPTRTADIDAE